MIKDAMKQSLGGANVYRSSEWIADSGIKISGNVCI